MISLWPLGTVSWECPPPFRMAPSSCQHLDPPLPHLTCLRERPNLHMGTRTMRGWPRAWAVSYTQSRCITWALPERPEMLDTLLFSIKRDARNLAERAQKLPPARLLLPSGWYDRAKLRSSWRIVVAVLASRETDSRFSQRRATSTVTRRHLPRWPGIAWFRHPHGAPLHIHHLLSLVQVSC